ncbi:MAG: S8 family serine peptidase, partial [Bacillales bacterium]|nr:S8 family serine peptidase [Bacillales bacterium]
MRKFLTILFITTLYLNLLPINHIANAQIVQDKQAAQEETTSRYIVFFKEDLDEQTIQSNGGEILQKYDSINAATIEIEENSLQELLKSGVITKASRENKVEISAQMTPWGHKTINLPAKQPETLSGKGVKIAIIDTGIDPSHPDLKVSGGYCALETALCGNSYRDENGHGTHVAGIIAAKDNEIGTVGVAPGAE